MPYFKYSMAKYHLIIFFYLSGLNKVAPILNSERWALIGAKIKIMWEVQLLDPTNNFITYVFKECLASLQIGNLTGSTVWNVR